MLTTLATVVFDGWSQTDRFGSFQQWFYDRWSFLAQHVDVLQTLSMLASSWSSSSPTSSSRAGTRRLLAVTLIPIAAVYFAAHYFAYLLIAGEDTPAVIVDPFGHSWNPSGGASTRCRRDRAGGGGLVDAGAVDRLGSRRSRSSPRIAWRCGPSTRRAR